MRHLFRGMRRLFTEDRGSAIVEMTLVGIPMIFVLISIFEMARGMWAYDTLAYAVRETSRYAIVHGQNCSVSPNSCAITVANLATRLLNAGVGLPADQLNATFHSLSDNVTCNPVSSCLGNNTVFPSAVGGSAGNPITISATYRFSSAISMFWPGAGRPIAFSPVNFPASSTDYVQF